ncbi:biotin/lipoyl-containing protein [Sulfurisphaera tokodaii]|uniref:Acetyl-CoA/propionyl-CoA carboxylase beta subunit n=2 Tax=Sulfurisphaera tokodaii TaxID=111955 RepID=F9VN46_SULTO|nr:acetyl-CoA carboxylase biotin carboxyl carrier protein subunit [Sulfurisphaera tokodaii]BAK54343.1 acetyl-CoA/propionyl-CoA carboxylase beta subunit [Sulfurisphaera tokodaii str. 7]HII74708.1 biotin/lipoyl-binding protein [Sulfurisphaera tokodaii]
MKLLRVSSELGDSYVMTYDQQGNKDTVSFEDNKFEIEYIGPGWREGELLFKINGEVHRVYVDNGFIVIDDETIFKVDRITETPIEQGKSIEELIKGKEGEILSPMQGRIVQIRVKEGDAVNKGQPLLSIEAMKSETVISAPVGGVVQKIMVKPGQGVKKGDLLLIIK